MRRLALLVSCLALTVCGDDAPSGGTDAAGDVAADAVFDAEVVQFDTGADTVEDTSTPADTDDTTQVDGGFGAPCQGNPDCDSGWCVEGESGYICTRECVETCPAGFDCKSVQSGSGDVIFLCVPRVLKLCTPCIEDFQCSGGACLDIDGSGQCAAFCTEEGDCPAGYTCAEAAGRSGRFCQPRSGSCECSTPFAGVARTCTRTNGIGTCFGVETCDPEVGWVGCSAREAAEETCDYVDNDCDGDVDEDYKTDGIYAAPQSCGSCTTDCDDILANAAETTCAVGQGVARCQVVSCEPGFTQVNPFVCAPDAGNACQPCTTAAECLGVGAACTQLSDGTFCTRACALQSDCTDGFVCQATPAGDQCVPESGSCTCDGSNTDLARSCSVTYTPPNPNDPAVTCRGLERCTASGWGECELPIEACDGIDNDCNGVVDDPFKTGDRYTALEHCGACGISCLAFARPNATPTCNVATPVPTCGYTCVGTAVDVNGRSDDGCECVPVAGPDLAGDSVDSNCDGVDGEVDNAIFVSRDGNNTNPGTKDLPVLTVQRGIDLAVSGNKRDVYVATGVYSESIIVANNVGVFGGYSPDFEEHDVLLFETALIGGAPTAQRPGTVNATNVGAASAARDTILDGFTIFGTNAANVVGASSYGIYLNTAGPKTRVSNNRIFAGPGGNGASGNRGNNGTAGVDGAGGLDAKNTSGCPPASGSNGGNGGSRTCGGTNVSGGNGGRADCPLYEESPVTANSGAAGNGTGAGTGGAAGWDFLICAGQIATCLGEVRCGTCYLPPSNNRTTAGSGTKGAGGTHGTAGAGGADGVGTVSGGLWAGRAGTAGGTGTPGAGGGGGGAGGGVHMAGTGCSAATYGDDDVGGSGGGGGSGGCAGTGGAAGSAGGGSFGIFIFQSSGTTTAAIINNTIHGGRGGNGGNGGPGGVGGIGGLGGLGGQPGDVSGGEIKRCAAGGGAGGAGGDGGHGGGGGGGAGGASYGIFASLPGGAPQVWKTQNTFASAGQGGSGGVGGVSLEPTRSGANGPNGSAANANY